MMFKKLFLFLFLSLFFVSFVSANFVYYKLDNNSSIGESFTKVVDSNGILNATTNIIGFNETSYLGNAAQFNNTLSRIVADADINYSGFAVMGWVRVPNSVVSKDLFMKWEAAGANTREFVVSISATGKAVLSISQDGTGSSLLTATSTTSINDSSWHFVAGTLEDDGKIYIYVDGIRETTGNTVTGVVDRGSPIELGRGRYLGAFGYGSIDEFRFYNYSLTNQNIFEIYASYGNCFNMSEDFDFVGSGQMCSGVYYLNDTRLPATLEGAVRSSGSNLVLDCNGASLVGNDIFRNSSGVGTVGIKVVGQNVTITNCNVTGYERGIYYAFSENGTMQNSVFYNNSFHLYLEKAYGIVVKNSDFVLSDFWGVVDYNGRNALFYNNTHNNGKSRILTAVNSDNFTVLDSYFTNTYEDLLGSETDSQVFISNSTNSLIRGNYLTLISLLFITDNSDNIVIENNYFYYLTGYVGTIYKNSKRGLIRDNIYNYTDMAIKLSENVSDTQIINNTVYNAFLHTDSYDIAIHTQSRRQNASMMSRNILIENNTLINFGCTGILLRGGEGYVIKGNYGFRDENYLLAQDFDCDNAPPSFIFLEHEYKGFFPTGTPSVLNYSYVSLHTINNVSIYDNTVLGTPILLRSQGATSVYTDFVCGWSYRFRIPELFGMDIICVDSNYSKVQTINPFYTLVDSFWYGFRHGNTYHRWFNLELNKDYLFVSSVNDTTYHNFSINASNTLVYYSNKSLFGNGLLSGVYDLYISPLLSFYVLDDFSINDTYNRPNSPINIDTVNNHKKAITSTLKSNIDVNVSLTYFYSSFVVSYPNYTSVKFSGVNYTNFVLNVQEGVTYLSSPEYARSRLVTDDPNYISYNDGLCGNSLVPYRFVQESGCSVYTGEECSSEMFGNQYDYTLLYEDYNSNNPIWSDADHSCLFRGVRYNDPDDIILVQAWRVNGNGGQYCTKQGRWDWYIYRYDSTYNNTNLTDPSYRDDLPYYDFPCDLTAPTEYEGRTFFPRFFTWDFTQNIYIVLLLLWIALIVVLTLFRLFTYAAVLTFVLSFVFLFSGIGLLWVILCIIGGFFLLLVRKIDFG